MRLPTGNGHRASGSRRKRSSPLCSKSASCSHDGKPPHTQKFRQFLGYNVQIAVEANHHLIVMHEVTNDGTDRSQLSHVANETKAVLGVDELDAVADRGYFNSEEIRACEEAGITVTLPKPMTSNSKAEGRFGKQDFRYVADEDVYVCPAGEKLPYSFTTQDKGIVLRRYRTTACHSCAIKNSYTKG